MKADPGYFGPTSMMWKVNKEITVLFGGAKYPGSALISKYYQIYG